MKYLVFILLLLPCLRAIAQPLNKQDAISMGVITRDMVPIESASFTMGNPVGKKNAQPLHTVYLKAYFIGKCEVTRNFWNWVIHYNRDSANYPMTWWEPRDEYPVTDVSWDSIQFFLAKLNTMIKVNGENNYFRLPTEAEWEYAASGGSLSKGYKYCGGNNLDSIAWYAPNAGGKAHPVGLKNPNELGLYDMSGNVWELCSDWYDANYYQHSLTDNPNNQKKAVFRVVRGGSWRSEEERCQVHARNRQVRDHNISNCGFRLVMEP